MSAPPFFLSVDHVVELHRLALETYGGLDGLRDEAGLESAVMQPQNLYLYNQEDLFGGTRRGVSRTSTIEPIQQRLTDIVPSDF